MKTTDRTILMALAGVALLAALWLLVVSPKRSELSELTDTADQLHASVSALEAEAVAGEAARDKFPKSYEQMVVLGKAVPSDDEEPDLIVGLQRIGDGAGVEFRQIQLGSGSALPVPEVVRPNPITGEDPAAASGEAPASGSETAPEAAATTAAAPADPAAASEAAAASLPIGATVGPAGLGVMPWDITFDGDFFDLSSVFSEIDYLVRFDRKAGSVVDGRLVTVDGFSLSRLDDDEVPRLKATLAVRSYVTPKGEGVTLGATPEGPATATPVSTGVAP